MLVQKTLEKFLYTFFWVIPWCLNFMCQHLGTPSLFYVSTFRNTQSVPKRQHIKFRHQVITQKNKYNIHNMAKVRNFEKLF
jgi:hypothetical protein